MNKNIINKYILPIGLFIIILILWEFGVWLADTPIYILPSPSDILKALIEDFPKLMSNAAVTIEETLLGMAIAIILAMSGALLMDKFGIMKNALYPLLVVSQTIPVIVLAPIFIIYLGFGMAPKVLTVVLMCFFPIIVTFTDGLSRVDERLVNLIKSYGANTLQVYGIIKIPGASDSLFSGMKIAATYSVTGAVVGEWLASDSGLGHYMLITKNGYMLDKVFASILIVIILSLLMNGLVRFIKYITMPALRGQSGENKRESKRKKGLGDEKSS